MPERITRAILCTVLSRAILLHFRVLLLQLFLLLYFCLFFNFFIFYLYLTFTYQIYLDDNKWMDKPAVDWILSKYQGYFIKKEDTANEGTWQGHIDKCVGQLCQENF
eukprot:Phypoly_transcript_22799.p2 GENE.Phypoly_transcript_22799~~Phypoly_transcript_22799.p2  ORF type:complete len:107 (+),score=3.59 Phypoly_transcript_22799:265-585(+)